MGVRRVPNKTHPIRESTCMRVPGERDKCGEWGKRWKLEAEGPLWALIGVFDYYIRLFSQALPQTGRLSRRPGRV